MVKILIQTGVVAGVFVGAAIIGAIGRHFAPKILRKKKKQEDED